MLRIRSAFLGPAIFVVIFAGIAVSALLGYWETESSRVPRRIASGDYTGEFDPADIRGSYSLGDIEKTFGIPAALVARAFGLEPMEDPAVFRANELEQMYGVTADGGEVGTDALRYFTALYTGLPYIPDESTRLPETALPVLEDKLATADLEVVSRITVPLADLLAAAELGMAEDGGTAESSGDEASIIGGEGVETPGADGFPVASIADEEHAEDEMTVKGRTTFGEILDWGLNQEEIEAVIGVGMGLRLENVRDFVVDAGLEYGTIRDALQALLDERKSAEDR